MTDGERKSPETAAYAPKSAAAVMLEDWISIWESELAALAADREGRESWLRRVSQWADRARETAAWLDAIDGVEGRSAGPGTPTRTAAADVAPDPRDAAIAQLARRVEELERRLRERQDDTVQSGAREIP